ICKGERFKVYLLILTNVIHGVLTIVFAGFSKKIIDAATVDKSFERVIYYALMFLGVIVFQMCLNLIGRSTSERCKAKIEWLLKQHMLNSIMKKDYAKISKFHTGELQNRMFNDVSVISDGFTTILPGVLFFLVKLISAFAYLVVIDKIFAVVFLVGGIAVFLCTQMFRKTLKRLHKDVQQTEGKTRSFIQEALTSLLVVKSFSVEKKIADEANELQSVNYKAKMKRRFFGIAANAGISFVFSLGYVFALAFGAYRLIHGISYGTVTAMLQLVNQIQSPFAALSGVMPKYFPLLRPRKDLWK
ncbi:MAG: ABC transporter ATP-binding protein, partial [Eubacterium sp.]|nr:ABC transporter ATP-binding protein [Eubacterium sp.]